MKTLLCCWLAISLASTHAATLLGDTVLIRRELPSLHFLTGPFPATVVAGPADTVSVSGGFNMYVNVESSSIFVSFGPQNGSGGGFADHRIVISDIDWFGQPDLIIGAVSATSDLASFQPGIVTFDAHSVSLWLGSLNWPGGQHVDIQLTPAVVPEPGALALLLAGAGTVLLLPVRKPLSRALTSRPCPLTNRRRTTSALRDCESNPVR